MKSKHTYRFLDISGPYRKRTNWHWLVALIILGFLAAVEIAYVASQEPYESQNTHPALNSSLRAASQATESPIRSVLVPKDSHNIRITWFGPECPTPWCRAHVGGEREIVVAVNYSKFGRPKAVYIPQFDRQYAVISNTDGLTDLDVWCDTDVACQQSVAQNPKLLVNLIY